MSRRVLIDSSTKKVLYDPDLQKVLVETETPDCTTCDDLPPTNPSGPPVHINIQLTLSGACDTHALSGTVAYDTDLVFQEEGPVSGHTFCAHDIWANGQGHGDYWSGTFTDTCTLDATTENFGGGGAAGLFGRDRGDCTWWMVLPIFSYFAIAGICDGCNFAPFPLPFQMISGAGDPSGVYVFSDTSNGVTLTVTVTIS